MLDEITANIIGIAQIMLNLSKGSFFLKIIDIVNKIIKLKDNI